MVRSTPIATIALAMFMAAPTYSAFAQSVDLNVRREQRAGCGVFETLLTEGSCAYSRNSNNVKAAERQRAVGRLAAQGRCDEARALALGDGDFALAREISSVCAQPGGAAINPLVIQDARCLALSNVWLRSIGSLREAGPLSAQNEALVEPATRLNAAASAAFDKSRGTYGTGGLSTAELESRLAADLPETSTDLISATSECYARLGVTPPKALSSK